MISARAGCAFILLGVVVILVLLVRLSLDRRARKLLERNLRGTRAGQTGRQQPSQKKAVEIISEVADQYSKKDPQSSTNNHMERWLKYAGLSITPIQFRAIWGGCIAGLYIVSLLIPRLSDVVRLIIGFCGGHLIAYNFVERRIAKRFKVFDQDFAPFMMSLVGLMKTGMNIMSAIDAAAERLGPDSTFRLEVARMIERLRFGISEEHAIGRFAEGINHPDIELFVQALLLNKQVGGSLSDTLERLARQARRRSQFRLQAQGAVGQQRGSVWVILLVIVGIQTMMYLNQPEMVLAGLKSDWGFVVWQCAGLMCWLAVWLVGKISKIRV